jgi:hypothetical protein
LLPAGASNYFHSYSSQSLWFSSVYFGFRSKYFNVVKGMGLLSFGAESDVFQVAIQKLKDQDI